MSHGEYLSTRHFGALDGLRGLAILLVFLAHPDNQFWVRFHGASGVTLFFVLSGYLITTLLLREEGVHGQVSFRRFYIRRLFRIYPMFFAVFLFYCVLVYVVGMEPARRPAFTESVPYILALFPEHTLFWAHGGVQPPFDGAWSIGIEEKFYLIWPILAFFALRSRPRLRFPLLLVIAAATAACGFVPSLYFLSPYQHIAYGALAALVLDSERGFAAASRLSRPVPAVAIVVVAIALQGTAEIFVDGGSLYWLDGLAWTGVLIVALTANPRATSVLSSPPARFLGAISYVFYLLHNFFLNAVERVVPNSTGTGAGTFVSTPIAFALAVGASYVVHRIYEEPLRRLGVQLANCVPQAPRRVGSETELSAFATRSPSGPEGERVDLERGSAPN